jgi:hypothetical protein
VCCKEEPLLQHEEPSFRVGGDSLEWDALQTSGDSPDETRRLALKAATEASTLLEEHEDLASSLGVNALVDQIHSSAVDLQGSTGLDRAVALRALQEATGRASW